ncbi:band 7 protein AGAP004871-like isoform X2 [Tigriopus californicus]|nr:band 7 protein AGAP004871-like isoform X2 [Tigriopus californicus]XP_059092299.1 band 7 protein AGAP004871-like isoform X2 [Tigriopus californicus]XP_059092300.1 band 7 protein AGAP004871-like isoform X2 [Tigriopus californicus]
MDRYKRSSVPTIITTAVTPTNEYPPPILQSPGSQVHIIENPTDPPLPPPPPSVPPPPQSRAMSMPSHAFNVPPPPESHPGSQYQRQGYSALVKQTQRQQPQISAHVVPVNMDESGVGRSRLTSHDVVDTEIRFGQRSGNIRMKKVKSVEKILRSQSRNGFGRGMSERGRNNHEKEPLINGSHHDNSGISFGVIGAEEPENGVGICGMLLTGISWILVIVTLPFSLCVCFKVVQEYERAVIFRLGRLLSGGSRGPGIFFVLPCIESYQKVDLRTITLSVPPQEVLTKDSVTVSVDAVVYYRVSNATVSVANVENAHHSTRLLAQTTLRNILGTKNLHEILSDRESISGSMQAALDDATEPWGIKVERVEIKDVRLPVQLQRAMAAEAEAAREARAKVIAAEGEQKASRALRDASNVIADTPAALQLRYLQTLNTISAEKNSTIVFPLPIDILNHIMKPKEE